MTPEQLKLRAVGQSAQSIQSTLHEIEGLVNVLVQKPDTKAHGYRLQGLHAQIEQEVKNLDYVITQGQQPASPDKQATGKKVQEAINEISQI